MFDPTRKIIFHVNLLVLVTLAQQRVKGNLLLLESLWDSTDPRQTCNHVKSDFCALGLTSVI